MSKPSRGNKKKKNTKQIIRRMPPMTPPKIRITFRWELSWSNAGAAPSVTKRFLSNSIWRPGVSSGNAAAPLLEVQGLFAVARVLGFKPLVYGSNNEAFPCVTAFTHSDEDPSVSAAATDAMGDLSTICQMSAKGGKDNCRYQRYVPIWKIIGNKRQVMYDDDFLSTISAGIESNPSNLTWFGVSTTSATGANITLGSTYVGYFEYDVELTARQIQTTSGQPGPILRDGKLYLNGKLITEQNENLLRDLIAIYT